MYVCVPWKAVIVLSVSFWLNKVKDWAWAVVCGRRVEQTDGLRGSWGVPSWALEVVLLPGTALRAAAVTLLSPQGPLMEACMQKRVTDGFWGLWGAIESIKDGHSFQVRKLFQGISALNLNFIEPPPEAESSWKAWKSFCWNGLWLPLSVISVNNFSISLYSHLGDYVHVQLGEKRHLFWKLLSFLESERKMIQNVVLEQKLRGFRSRI